MLTGFQKISAMENSKTNSTKNYQNTSCRNGNTLPTAMGTFSSRISCNLLIIGIQLFIVFPNIVIGLVTYGSPTQYNIVNGMRIIASAVSFPNSVNSTLVIVDEAGRLHLYRLDGDKEKLNPYAISNRLLPSGFYDPDKIINLEGTNTFMILMKNGTGALINKKIVTIDIGSRFRGSFADFVLRDVPTNYEVHSFYEIVGKNYLLLLCAKNAVLVSKLSLALVEDYTSLLGPSFATSTSLNFTSAIVLNSTSFLIAVQNCSSSSYLYLVDIKTFTKVNVAVNKTEQLASISAMDYHKADDILLMGVSYQSSTSYYLVARKLFNEEGIAQDNSINKLDAIKFYDFETTRQTSYYFVLGSTATLRTVKGFLTYNIIIFSELPNHSVQRPLFGQLDAVLPTHCLIGAHGKVE